MGWLLDRYPEIAHLPRREQELLVDGARRRVLRGVRHRALGILPFVLLPAGMLIIANLNLASIRLTLLTASAFGGLWLWVQWLIARRRCHVMRRALRDDLSRQGTRPACCFNCGYDLRAAEADVCPECGTRYIGAGS